MFDGRDTAASAPVVIVNQLLARRYFGSQSAIGEHLTGGSEGMLRQPMEIIGVVQDAKYISLSEDFQPEAYFPLSQIQENVDEYTTFELRTAVNPSAMIRAARDALAAVNKSASLRFVTLKQEAGDSVLQEQLLAVLSGFFGVLALLLTAIGLFGVMSYVVALRTHEIGIRMALGAQRGSVLRLVARDAAFVMSMGIGAGLLGSIAVTRLIQQLLFGVEPTDPWSLSLAVAALLGVAAIATYLPARRAMRVDPARALRCE